MAVKILIYRYIVDHPGVFWWAGAGAYQNPKRVTRQAKKLLLFAGTLSLSPSLPLTFVQLVYH